MTTATSLKTRLPADIRTARLVLAAPVADHAPAIAQLANNPNIHRWMARLPFPYTLGDAQVFLDEVVPSPEERCYAITLDGELIGIISLRMDDEAAPELGYWLAEPFWGRGYATEAARALVDAARAAGVTQLRSRALMDNAGSRNVLTKVGFTETHEAIDTIGNCSGKIAVHMQMDLGR